MIKQRKIDIIVIGILLILSLAIYLFFNFYKDTSTDVYAEIILKGDVVKTVFLDEDKTFLIEEVPNVKFEIKDKKIRFLESDCPDKVCVNTGFIGSSGQTAVCLPNALSVKIVPIDTNSKDSDVVI